MGVIIAIVVVALLVYLSFGRYTRVLLRRRYDWNRSKAPDLGDFSEGP